MYPSFRSMIRLATSSSDLGSSALNIWIWRWWWNRSRINLCRQSQNPTIFPMDSGIYFTRQSTAMISSTPAAHTNIQTWPWRYTCDEMLRRISSTWFYLVPYFQDLYCWPLFYPLSQGRELVCASLSCSQSPSSSRCWYFISSIRPPIGFKFFMFQHFS